MTVTSATTDMHAVTTIPDFSTGNDTCVDTSPREYQAVWGTFSGLACAINVFMFVAMIKSWGILRQNVTYYYVLGCLLSSMVFCIVTLYEVILTIYSLDIGQSTTEGSLRFNASIPEHTGAMRRSAIRKALIPSLFITIQLNIVSLIYGVSDNAFFVGRYSEPKPLPQFQTDIRGSKVDKHRFGVRALKWKRNKAVLSIVISWVVPLTFAIPVPLGWNCIKYCTCLPIVTAKPYCVPAEGSGTSCSRLWHPLSSSFFVVTSSVWSAGMVLMFATLMNTILKFYRTHAPRDVIHGGVKAELKESPLTDAKQARHTSQHSSRESLYTSNGQKEDECKNKRYLQAVLQNARATKPISEHGHRRGVRPPLAPVVKMLISLSVYSFVCVFPLMAVCLLDSVIPAETAASVPFNVSLTISFIYASTLPILLVKHMSGLRKAINNIIMKCPCFRTTVVTKGRPSLTPSEMSRSKKVSCLENDVIPENNNSIAVSGFRLDAPGENDDEMGPDVHRL